MTGFRRSGSVLSAALECHVVLFFFLSLLLVMFFLSGFNKRVLLAVF